MCGTYAVNITLEIRDEDKDHATFAQICNEFKYDGFSFRYWPGMVAIKGSKDWTVYPAKRSPPWNRWVFEIARCTEEGAEEMRMRCQNFMDGTVSAKYYVTVKTIE